MKDLKVIFMGTPDFAVPILEYLIKTVNVVLVVTQADKIVGRKKEIAFSPVKKVALENNISLFQPEKIRNNFEIISEINPDLIVTCAYGQIIPKEILDIPSLGCINIHASLLPKYRGASPIQMAILNGEKKTGITIMYMDEHMDTGDIISQRETEISLEDDCGTLFFKLSILGVELLNDTLESIYKKENQRLKQNEALATYTKLIKREDEHLSFDDTGENIVNKIRALSPMPLANFILNDQEIKVIKASFTKASAGDVGKVIFGKKTMQISCKDGYINLLRVKPFGKKEMDVASFVNGLKEKEDTYAK